MTSVGKGYWVPHGKATVEVLFNQTIHSILLQLCYIFHRSYDMSVYKENYPCKAHAEKLMLYEVKTNKRLYSVNKDSKMLTLEFYKIKNNTKFKLYYF